jgi:hypothetical protein
MPSKINSKKKTKKAKVNARKIFTDNEKRVPTCVICNKEDSITFAHIISSALDDYSLFGIKNNYKDDLDVFSERNFMPLCGTEGENGSCLDAIDKHLIHVRYDVFQKLYHVNCSPNAPEHFIEISKRSLIVPPGWNPYHRLLAWRSRKCGTEYGFIPDFGSFETMNRFSENSNSVRDINDDMNGDASITEVSEIDSFQEKRPRLN